MAVKIRYTHKAGLYHEGGEGIICETTPSMVASGSVREIAGNVTLTVPGVYKTSGGRALTMPNPADYPGGVFIIHQSDGSGTTITPVQDSTLFSTFNAAGNSGNGTQRAGACANALASSGVANDSVTLISDGVNWQVIGFRGTWNIL